MRSTMRTITDVSIDGRAVDTTQESLKFTSNSDCLSRVYFDWRDTGTGQTWTGYMGDGVSAIVPRGGTVNVSLSAGFTAGHDYVCTPTIYQADPNAEESETSPALFDVYMGTGRVRADSSVTTEIWIDKDIDFIRTPVRVSDKLCGGCVIKLSDGRAFLIESYDKSTGKATVSAARINGATSTLRATTQGEAVKLITNYLICDSFVFSARTTPTISLSTEITADGIVVTGTYAQAQGVALQSWRMWAEYGLPMTSQNKQTIEHDTMYTYTIEDTFPVLANSESLSVAAGCDIYCEVVTQDGQTATAKAEIRLQAPDDIDVQTIGNAIIAEDFAGTIWVWRFDGGVSEGAPHCEGSSDHAVIGEGTSKIITDDRIGVSADYIVVGRDAEGDLHFGQAFNRTITKGKIWTIQHLIRQGLHEYRRDGDVYTFSVDVQPSAIETITNAAVYGTEARYPRVIAGFDRYDTGSFTALLGSIRKLEADANDIDGWNSFISQGGVFLLKTEAGDVKIVAITGNPARQYGSSLAEIGLTRVTITWAEVDDIDRAVIE